VPGLTDLTGLAGAALVITAAAVATGRAFGLGRPRLAILAGVSALVALVPVGVLPPAGLLRGVVGDLSVTTLVLLGAVTLRRIRDGEPIALRSRTVLQLLVAAGGVMLYALALGLGPWDPYRLGYGDAWFLAALLAIALASLVADIRLVTLVLALSVLAWALGLYESRNLWDLLLDPLVFTWAFSSILFRGTRALVRGHWRAAEELVRVRGESSS
jgi:hypothetical protein